MRSRDGDYSFSKWPGDVFAYMDIDWLAHTKALPVEELSLPHGYFINPDETDENSISGPQRDKVLELFHDLNDPPITVDVIERSRGTIRTRSDIIRQS